MTPVLVYKVHMRPGRTYPAKFLADLRPDVGKRIIGIMSTYSVPEHCTCREIDTDYKGKVVLVSRASSLAVGGNDRGHMALNAGHTLIRIDNVHRVEGEIQRIIRSDLCQLRKV